MKTVFSKISEFFVELKKLNACVPLIFFKNLKINLFLNKLAKLEDAIAISNLKLSMTDRGRC